MRYNLMREREKERDFIQIVMILFALTLYFDTSKCKTNQEIIKRFFYHLLGPYFMNNLITERDCKHLCPYIYRGVTHNKKRCSNLNMMKIHVYNKNE